MTPATREFYALEKLWSVGGSDHADPGWATAALRCISPVQQLLARYPGMRIHL